MKIPLPSTPFGPAAGSLLVTLLLCATVTLVATGCGGGGGGGAAAPTVPPANAPSEQALAASKPGELLDYVKGKLKDRAAQRQVSGDAVFFTGGTVAVTTTGATDTSNRSSTVVQEAGVDEDDLLKTDGSTLFALVPPLAGVQYVTAPSIELRTWSRSADGTAVPRGAVPVLVDKEVSVYARGMLLAAGAPRAAVVGESQMFACLASSSSVGICPAVGIVADILPFPQRWQSTVHVDLVNVANPAAPTLGDRWRIDGRLVGSRMIGSRLFLVTQFTPTLAVDALPADAKDSEREALLARLTTAELLPTIRVNGGAPQPLVTDTDCFVQAKNAAPGVEITTITTIDLADAAIGGGGRTSRCFAGGSEAIYMSPSSLYIATTRYNYTAALASLIRMPAQMRTDVHKFVFGAGVPDYRGSGEVAGHLGWDVQRKPYRMSEWGGDLRVLTYTGETGWGVVIDPTNSPTLPAPSPAQLTILRERTSDKTLQVVSTLPNAQRPQTIGKPGEQLYGVRFLGNRGYAVTFRRTDPLYVLDLSNPADPKAAGELQITGYSDYLFPLDNGLLLGVGKEADERGRVSGVKVSLFDVADPALPKSLASQVFGGAPSQSALDYSSHGINLFTRNGVTRVALPVSLRNDYIEEPKRGLQRLEVNAAAKTLISKPLLSTGKPKPWSDLSAERSLQIENKVYYFSDSALTTWDW